MRRSPGTSGVQRRDADGRRSRRAPRSRRRPSTPPKVGRDCRRARASRARQLVVVHDGRAGAGGRAPATLSLYDDSTRCRRRSRSPTPSAGDARGPVRELRRTASSPASASTRGRTTPGTHVGALWAVGGTHPLAQATFTSRARQGWQTLTFATPVHITKDTEYVASYRTHRRAGTRRPSEAFSGVGVQRAPLRTDADERRCTPTPTPTPARRARPATWSTSSSRRTRQRWP